MINNENRRVGYTEVYYNYKTDAFFTEDPGNQFRSLNISTGGGGGGGNGIQAGDNISLLTNDSNYLSSGANISTLVNNVGYLTSHALPTVASLPTANLSFGDLVALSTDNSPYFYDGTAWRRFFLADIPPQAGDPDTDWDKVLIRSPFNTNTDDVKQNATGSGFASIVGSPKKFGAGSVRMQGSHSVNYGHSFVGNFLLSDFTIEAWIYFDTLDPQLQIGIFSKGVTHFFYENAGANVLDFGVRMTQTVPAQTVKFTGTLSSADSLQNWNHFAFCRSATTGQCQLFINGVSKGSVNLNNVVDNGNYLFTVGDLLENDADMFVDDLRISNFERYTANFTPPTAELPTSG